MSESSNSTTETADTVHGGGRSAVVHCVEGMRKMILNRTLLPGEQIRQAEMAERLGVSRVPLREALKMLETEGVLIHYHNQGYFVAKMRASELSQIYLMRRLLESELLRKLEWPNEASLKILVETNQSMQRAINDGRLEDLVAANRAFHFQIFEFSSLHLVRKEIQRLWALSEPYRAVYLYEPVARDRIIREHATLIDALADRDEERLVSISDHHRSGLERHMAGLLAPNQPEDDRGSPSSEFNGKI